MTAAALDTLSPELPQGFRTALERLVPGAWTQDAMARVIYSRDLWPRVHLMRRAGTVAPAPPHAIAWPQSAEATAGLLQAAREHGVAVVPFGGGSGVCGGTQGPRGAVTIDTKRMAAVLRTDAVAGLAQVQGGIIVQLLEDELNRRGLTLGHFPSSLMCATLGGCLAARSAGQLSSRYGKIEDMVLGMRVAMVDGSVLDTDPWQGGTAVHGLDWNELIVGSEGTLGVVCDATMRVHPLCQHRVARGFEFRSLDGAIDAMRRLMQAGLRPSVVRLYDELDTFIASSGSSGGGGAAEGHSSERGPLDRLLRSMGIGERVMQSVLEHPDLLSRLLDVLPTLLPTRCLLVVLFEGTAQRATLTEAEAGHRLLLAAGGRDLGPGPGERWLRTRYAVSFKQSKVFAAGAFADTMEVAATWDRIPDLYRSVRREVGSLAVVMAHFSHAYHTGCSIYFTFAGAARDPEAALHRYDTIWRRAQRAVLAAGGTISHHHGVGRSKRDSMPAEHGPEGLRILRALSVSIGSPATLNPGSLGLEKPPARRGRSGVHSAYTAEPAMHVDTVAGTLRGPASTRLADLERAARARGLTLRPWHGAFAATGEMGKILQAGWAWRRPCRDGAAAGRPIALSATLRDGALLITPRTPRRAAGPEVAAALLAGGHANGTLSAVELRAEPIAERTVVRKLELPSLSASVDAARRLVRAGLPAVVWIEDTTLSCLLEGPSDAVDAWDAVAERVLSEPEGVGDSSGRVTQEVLDGITLPAEPARRAPARFEIAARYSDLAAVADEALSQVEEASGERPALRLFQFGHAGGRLLLTPSAAAATKVGALLTERFARPAALGALDEALMARIALGDAGEPA